MALLTRGELRSVCSHEFSEFRSTERVDLTAVTVVRMKYRRSNRPVSVLVGHDVVVDAEPFPVFVCCVGCPIRFAVDDVDTISRDVE